MKYKFLETVISYETFLHYNPERPAIQDYRDIIKENNDKFRIISYSHLFPDGSESICYNISNYLPLSKAFGKRLLKWEELVLLLYGIIHTIANARKCGLEKGEFVLNPNYIYLDHDSIQPYLIYIPAETDISLREEFISLLTFLENCYDLEYVNSEKLIRLLQNISQTEPLDIRAVAKVVVDAANTNEVKAPPPPVSVKPQAAKPQAAKSQAAKPQAAAAANPAPAPPPAVDNQVKKQPAPRYMPKPAESKPEKQEPKRGFFTRVFGWAIKQKDPDDFLPAIDDKTMIDFEAYDETANIPVLFVLEGEARTEQIPITGDSFVLGRNKSEVDHCFETDRGISRVHAEVIYNGSNYFIVDRGSAGGTFVNGERVASGQSSPIKTGDIIGLYKKKLVFEIV